MSDSFVTIILILIAAVMLFMVPMIAVSHRKDVVSTQTVQAAINEFVDSTRKTGKVTQEEFSNLVQTLETTGETYEVNVNINNIDENPSKKDTSSVVDQVKIGENIYYTEYTTQVEKKLEENNGEIKLSTGDFVTVDVENKSQTMYQGFKKLLYSIVDTSPQISGTYGGMVLEENNPENIKYEEEHVYYKVHYDRNITDSTSRAYWGSEEWKTVRNEQYGINASVKAKAAKVNSVHRPGYECIGWNTQPDGSGIQYLSDVELPQEEITLYAQWNPKSALTITYNDNSELASGINIDTSTIPHRQSVLYDDTVKIPDTVPTDRTNSYTCRGWSTNKDAILPEYTFGATTQRIKENITLYAIWSTNERSTIKFDTRGGSYIEDKNVVKGTVITLPSATKDGYELKGWTTNRNSNNVEFTDGASYRVNGDTTLYAIWGPKNYYLDVNGWLDEVLTWNTNGYGTFDVVINGTTVSSGVTDFYQQIPFGSTYEIKNIKGTDAHKYNGVYSGQISGTMGAQDTSVVLNFTTEEYAVTFDKQDGSTPYAIQGKYGAYIQLPNESRTGYEFKGWATNKNATKGDYAGNSYFQIKDKKTTLYAIWETETNTIKFDGMGGTTPSAIQGKYDTYIDNLPESTRNGYTFAGWATSEDVTNVKYKKGEKYHITGSTTLYAVWEAIGYYIDVNVSLNDEIVYNTNNYIVFDVYINNELYAIEVSDFYEKLSYGTKYEITNIKVKTGFKYEGVYKGNLEGTNPINGTEIILKISSQKYTLIFEDDNGNISERKKYAYYGDTVTLPTGTKTEEIMNYELEGWQNDGGMYNGTWKCEGEIVEENTSIYFYPVWKAVSVNISQNYVRTWQSGDSVSGGWGQAKIDENNNEKGDIELPKNIKVTSIKGSAAMGFTNNVAERYFGLKIEAYNGESWVELLNEKSENFGFWLFGAHRKQRINNVEDKISNSKLNVSYTKLRCSYYFSNDVNSGGRKYAEFALMVYMVQAYDDFVETLPKD